MLTEDYKYIFLEGHRCPTRSTFSIPKRRYERKEQMEQLEHLYKVG